MTDLPTGVVSPISALSGYATTCYDRLRTLSRVNWPAPRRVEPARRLSVKKFPGPDPWKVTTVSTLTGAVMIVSSYGSHRDAYRAAWLATHPCRARAGRAA
ncbi:hypothetical protein EV383_4434 [Pseudonocardia sediminis]|uniref:Uncharacterized protein n=1 Tax=Pseudonocardia sediminis TaxID=1397368 RepID=A0A4Q7V4H2_PSEST|nr:hypothetical protein EV383_4434 [Pseudonocardia sediminis]